MTTVAAPVFLIPDQAVHGRQDRTSIAHAENQSQGRESNPQETDLQSVALTILPPWRGRGQEPFP